MLSVSIKLLERELEDAAATADFTSYKEIEDRLNVLIEQKLELEADEVKEEVDDSVRTEAVLCPTCGKQFQSKADLKSHRKSVHKVQACVCDERNGVRDDQTVHLPQTFASSQF